MCMFGREFKRGCLFGGEDVLVGLYFYGGGILHYFTALKHLVAVCCFYGVN